jgi:ATP-binding cassette subfamily B protein
MNRSIQDAIIASDRLFQILDLEQEIEVKESVSIKSKEIKQIRVENIVFRYGSGVNIFENLSLEIPQGAFAGIVGESGSGKSTLLNLIQGIYKPNKGKIYIGDYDTNYISKESITRLISCVPQRIDLFSGTILENIVLSDQIPDIGKVLRICREVGVEGLINSLPEGLYTIIGEKGIRFSGGEQQKIAHARALYTEPEILLLDEPGSSLDYKAENGIIDLILNLKNEGKTIILVTHRLSSIEKCDLIFYIENGTVREQGIHEDLISQKGQYYLLWKRQFREVLIEN